MGSRSTKHWSARTAWVQPQSAARLACRFSRTDRALELETALRNYARPQSDRSKQRDALGEVGRGIVDHEQASRGRQSGRCLPNDLFDHCPAVTSGVIRTVRIL